MTDKNERKPFYRRNWFWIMIVSIFVVVSATTYISNYMYYQGKADSTSVKKPKINNKIENNPSLVAKYNSIKTGKSGYSKDAVTKLLGQPTTMEQVDVNNQIDDLIWNGYDNSHQITIKITFTKNKATAKSIQGLDIDRKKLLTMEDYDKLQEGDSYNKVIKILGDPDEYSHNNGVKTLTYESDISEADPSQTASIQIEITNNVIAYKSQTNLK